MDETRDIQKDHFSRFLDVQLRTNPFGENRSGERAYRRAERLVAALFLVTNHIPAEEPLRRQLRASASSLLPKMLSIREEMRSLPGAKAGDLQATIRQLISEVRMLVFAGFVSPQNAEAVCGALDELGNFLGLAQRTNLSENLRISKEELLDVPEIHKRLLKDIKDRRPQKDISSIKDNATEYSATALMSQGNSTARSASILEVLRGGGELNIRDIAANLPEYGEKTIQRELNTLIARGSVRRIGARRWSKYAVAQ